MSGTYEEQVWLGNDTSYTAAEGTLKVLHGVSPHCRVVPTELVWRVHITANPGVGPHQVWLPDARHMPLGGPLFHFIVTADAGVTTPFTIKGSGGTGLEIFYTAPTSIKMYCVDNTYEVGLWAWKETTFETHSESLSTGVASFGGSPNLDNVWLYDVLGDSWSADTAVGADMYRCGASWSGAYALIRKGVGVFTYTMSTAAFQSNGNANVDKCSFVRMSGTAIGSRHYGFGAELGGSHLSDYYVRTTNSFTVIPSNPTVGWNEGAAVGIAGKQPQERHHCIQLLARNAGGAAPWPTWIFYSFTEQYSTIQNFPTPHYQWAPIVSLRRSAHVMGGGSYYSTTFNVGMRYHHKYVFDFDGLFGFGWQNKPWIPKALRGHGNRQLPGRNGDRRCIFSMGKDHSFFPGNNEEGWRYDDLAESYSAAGGSTWTNLQEQNTSWAHVN